MVMVEVGSGLGLGVLEAVSHGLRVVGLEALRSNLALMHRALAANGWLYAHLNTGHLSTTGTAAFLARTSEDVQASGAKEAVARFLAACSSTDMHERAERQDGDGGIVCSLDAAVGRCGGHGGGSAVVATVVDDEGAGHVLDSASRHVS